MDFQQIVIAFISGGVAATLIQHLLDRRKEREAEWRRSKLDFYIEFIEALSGILEGEKTKENEIAFAKACNNLYLFSPKGVLGALQKYQDEISASNKNQSARRYADCLRRLICEIRRDIKINDPKIGDLEVRLWTTGTNNKTETI